ncbi:PEP-CTERM sorting domain-containing protein [Aeoliella sp.]|uniref:PEP-CTERM sorting domain-containing protein n=1 Tax=Aeoliella sp. TaxID=2795800 RepID=UPI003CCBF076
MKFSWQGGVAKAMARSVMLAIVVGAMGTANSATIVTVNAPASQDATLQENYGRLSPTPVVDPVIDRETTNDNGNSLLIRNRSNSANTESSPRHEAAIIEFPLAPIAAQLAGGGVLQDIGLSMTPTSTRGNNYLRAYGIRAADDGDWDQTTVTYANAPAMYPDTVNVLDGNNVVVDVLNDVSDEYSGSPSVHQQLDMVPLDATDNTDLIGTLFGVVRVNNGGTVDADVPLVYWSENPGSGFSGPMSGLKDFVETAIAEGDDSITLIIHANRASSQSLRYYSTEGAPMDGFEPHLIAQIEVPEPSTVAIGGLGLACLIAARRRSRR